MQLAYNSSLPIIIKNKKWPLGKYFSDDNKGKSFDVDTKQGLKLLKLGTKSAKLFIEKKGQPRKVETITENKEL